MKFTSLTVQRIKELVGRRGSIAVTAQPILSLRKSRTAPKWAREVVAAFRQPRIHQALFPIAILLLMATPMFAQSDPWSAAINKIAPVFQGPIAKGMSIIGVVAGAFGLIFDTGHHAKTLSGIVLGVSMALGATAFLSAFFS